MKKLFVFLILVIFIFQTASAVAISGNTDFSVYPCQTSDRSLTIGNASPNDQTFFLTVSGEIKDWLTAAPDALSIKSNSSEQAFLFLTGNCYAAPGTYTSKLLVNDGSTITEKLITVTILQGHSLQASLNESSKTACQNQSTSFLLRLKNLGQFDEKLNLQVLSTQLLVSAPSAIDLKKNEEKTISISVSAEGLAPNTYPIEFKLFNDLKSVNQTLQASVQIQNCFDFSIEKSVPIVTCVDSLNSNQLTSTISIRNNGTQNIALSVTTAGALADVSESAFSLNPQQQKSIAVSLRSAEALNQSVGEKNLVVSFASPYSTKQIPLNYHLQKCVNLQTNPTIVQLSIAPATTQNISIQVANEGLTRQNWRAELIPSLDFVLLQPRDFNINVNETKSLFLYVSPSTETQAQSYESVLRLTTVNGSISKEIPIFITVESVNENSTVPSVHSIADNNQSIPSTNLNADSNSTASPSTGFASLAPSIGFGILILIIILFIIGLVAVTKNNRKPKDKPVQNLLDWAEKHKQGYT